MIKKLLSGFFMFTLMMLTLPVTVFAASELTTNIEDLTFKVGVPTEFTFSTVADENAGVMVVGTSNFSDADAIEMLEYYEVKDGNWYEFTGDFGPATGFPMSDAESKFRVTFKTAGTYTFTASMKSVEDEAELCSTEVEFTVVDKEASELKTDIGEKRFKVGVPTEFTFSTVANDYAGVMVVGTSNFSNADAIEKLEYYEVKDGNWYEFTGDFGPATGFPMSDAESKFRVTFKTTGTYTFTASMKSVEDDTVLCSTEVEFTVAKKSSGGGGSSSKYYYLSFETNGGDSITRVKCDKGEEVDLTEYTTEKEGYTFTGWYADKALTEKITEIAMSSKKTVYAGWEAIEEEETRFIDVKENDWFYDAVEYVAESNLMNGTSETEFSPYMNATRAMFVTILYRLDGEVDVSGEHEFEDVESGEYYEKAIIWASENDIVYGYGNGNFGPEDNITREQMVVILYRYAQYKNLDVSVGEDTNILSYNDALEITEYAIPAMQWACGTTLIKGYDNNLMPTDNATRAEVATVLYRLCENIIK